MKAKRIINILSAALLLVGSGSVTAQAQSKLDGMIWSSLTTVSNVGGALQGAAYYNGTIYQFADAGKGHGLYNLSTKKWTAGGAINSGYLASCHFGSACFGPESTKNYTVNGTAHTSTFPLLFVTGHDKTSGSRAHIINVIDYEQKTLVASLRFQDTGSQDDMIAAYDFAGGKIYLMGYPGNVVGMAPWTIREYSGISFNNFTTTDRSITFTVNSVSSTVDVPSVDLTSAAHTDVTGIGGPGASGIQEDLVAGTLQDCHYSDGHIYFVVTRGSRYNRTEWMRVHDYDVSAKKVIKTVTSAVNSEPEGFTFDDVNTIFYVTTGGDGIEGRNSLFKLAAGSAKNAYNFQTATKNGDYYEISNASQFVWFKQQVYSGCTTMKARLTADIDMTGQTDPFTYYVYDEASSRSFDAQYAFRGEFDGNNHTIKNVSITKTPHYNDGLFPYVIGANIHDLTVTGKLTATATTDKKSSSDNDVQNVGLIGKMNGGTLSNINIAGWSVDVASSFSSANVNQLVGAEVGTITKTNIVVQPHNGNGHTYVNGFCSKSDAVSSEDGYYETPSGSGTSADPFLIDNAGKLFWFAQYVNMGGANVSACARLTADINMDGTNHTNFPGVGASGTTTSAAYQGTFDGQGHTISNYYRKVTAGYSGFFNSTYQATLKDFTISGTFDINASVNHLGGIAGTCLGNSSQPTTITDVHCAIDINCLQNANSVGGMIGRGSVTMNRCRYSGTLDGRDKTARQLGGFGGSIQNGFTLNNCLFDGTIKTTSTITDGNFRVGGFFAGHDNGGNVTITNSLVNATISLPSTTPLSYNRVGIIYGIGDLNSGLKLTISNTYYTRTKVSDIGSTPLPVYGAITKTASDTDISVTEVTTQSWSAIKNALNNGSTNWGINSNKADYPLPNEEDMDVTPVTKYTVIFKDWNGSELQNTKVDEGSTISKPDDPTRDGYTFDGWTTDGTTIETWPQTATKDVTFTAKYTQNPATEYVNGFKTSGSSSDSDYYETATLDSADGYYIIDNAGKLFWFANQVNAGNASINAKVTADIDMDGTNHSDFPGIGIYESKAGGERKPFSGNFDGQKHRIYNCNITSKGSGYWGGGLIATANGTNKVIKDFTLEGKVTLNSGAYAGGALGYIEQGYTISGITSSVTITTKAGKTGGVAGFVNTGSISQCRYNGTLTSSTVNVGGVIGETAVSMTDCLFDGKIISTQTSNAGSCVGGIAAAARGVTIKNCLSYGTITTAITGVSTSMVIGRVENDNLTLTNVYYGAQGTSTPTITCNYNGKTVNGDVTYVGDDPDWFAIQTVLRNGNDDIWGINSQDYPVPGETDNPSIIKYTITFIDYNDDVITSRKVREGNTIVAPSPSPERTGYTFTGWDPALAEGTVATKDQTYKAQYSINSYTITYYVDNVQYGDPDTYEYGAAVTARAYPEGANFSGWTPAVPATMPAYNLEVFGSFTRYTNGFNDDSTCAENMKYEAPILISTARCAELGIDASYATNGYYEVKNAGNMFWISKNFSADNNSRKYVVTADIDMEGNKDAHKDWAGIGEWTNGSSDKNFKGIFDGNGHKFTNYYMNITSGSWKAMFCVPNGATIKNFSISGNMDVSATGTQYGVIGGRIAATTTFEDIYSAVNITVATGITPASIGGIVGQCSAPTSFNRCRYSGTITANSAYKNIGGIIGNAEHQITLDNCLFDGVISSTSTKTGSGEDAIQIGGVCGRNNQKTTINNCLMIGAIMVDASSEAVDAEKTHTGIVFGYQCTTADLTITNTYYNTSKCTSGIRAVGLNNATNKGKAAPTEITKNLTEITAQEWKDIRASLGKLNWQIDMVKYGKEYPIPEYRVHVHTYDKYGYCTNDDCDHSAMPSVMEGKYYLISNVAQLKAFRDAVYTAAGASVNGKLVQDVDFEGYTGTFGDPIGPSESRPYVGEFDGQNYTINSFSAVFDNIHYAGLFGYVGNDSNANQIATIKNFRISGSITSNYSSTANPSYCNEAHIGVIARLNNGSVEGISSSMSISNGACTAAHYGGIVGCTLGSNSDKSVSNCQFTGSITADAWDAVGGIIGYTSGNITLKSNYFGGSIDLSSCTDGNTTYLGGIFGYGGIDDRPLEMAYNVSYGTLTPPSGGTIYKGVILGKTTSTVGVYTDNYSKDTPDPSSEEVKKITNIKVAPNLTIDEITTKLGIHWCVLDDGTTLGTDNIISVDDQKNYLLKYIYIDDKADKLTWKYDNFDKDALSVIARKVIYVRANEYMTNQLISICLPFTLNASSLHIGTETVSCEVLQYDHMDTSKGDAMFIPVLDHRCLAGVPYLLKLPESTKDMADKMWRVELSSSKGITLLNSVKNPSTTSTNIFGSFETGVISAGYYKLHPNGQKFVQSRDGSHCFPYRAYLKVVNANTGTTSVDIETE